MGHRTAGRAPVPVEAAAVGGARIRPLSARPRPRSAGAAQRSAGLSAPRARRPTCSPTPTSTRLLSAASQRAQAAADAPRRITRLFGLLAVTGMRVGEAVGLDLDDVDLDAGADRDPREQVPQVATDTGAPDHCRGVARLFPTATTVCAPDRPRARFFVSSRAGRITTRRARAMFARLVDHAGLQPRAGPVRRVHDLRHSFAVATPARLVSRRRRRRSPDAAAVGLPRPRRPRIDVLVPAGHAGTAGRGRPSGSSSTSGQRP